MFAAFGVLAVFGTGNATQVNTITTAIDSALSSFNALPADAVKLVNLIIGVALAIIIALILIGGIKRIGNVTSKLVPFMAIMYIVLALGVIISILSLCLLYLLLLSKVLSILPLSPAVWSEASS